MPAKKHQPLLVLLGGGVGLVWFSLVGFCLFIWLVGRGYFDFFGSCLSAIYLCVLADVCVSVHQHSQAHMLRHMKACSCEGFWKGLSSSRSTLHIEIRSPELRLVHLVVLASLHDVRTPVSASRVLSWLPNSSIYGWVGFRGSKLQC